MTSPRARPPRLLSRAGESLLSYGVVAAKRHLDFVYLAQLERYRSLRLCGWICRHWRIVLDPREAFVQTVVLVAGLVFASLDLPVVVFYIVWAAAGMWLGARGCSLQVSQRLQFTPRAVRLSTVTLILALGVVLGIAMIVQGLLSGLAVGSSTFTVAIGLAAGLAVASEVAAGTVLLANLLLIPLEQGINRRLVAQAAHRMRTYPGQVVGITGSYGKTTTKFITAALLGRRYPISKTPDGVNTTMGITRVVREDLRDDHRFFVVEVAAYGPGEIREVCEFLRPKLGILTAVGVQHLERFGTPERIAETKYELIASLPSDGVAIMNADDPGCLPLIDRARREGRRTILYGIGEDARTLDVRGKNIKTSSRGSAFCVQTEAGTALLETKLLGNLNIANILGAVAAALECGVTLEEIRAGVGSLTPAPKRLEVREEGGLVKLIDVANANPRGAQMALDVLGQFGGGARILITPGLVELGRIEDEENRRLGRAAAAVCDYVVLVGPTQTLSLREGLREGGFSESRVLVVRHSDDVADCLRDIVRQGDILLYENRLPDTYLELP
ncbi:MAG: UDP-N-acetylmuramoyl-tripeptide--D-alanyl-D-alanine ligase [Candidatus Methylomirabilis oxyfera]|nr:UDP-N-acetylmuramoyl-tripeptide--D-alanyl-D-alanine ligase [Candidatus Methylomirabilis oxyfera]